MIQVNKVHLYSHSSIKWLFVSLTSRVTSMLLCLQVE
jgi:hypothetical protein